VLAVVRRILRVRAVVRRILRAQAAVRRILRVRVVVRRILRALAQRGASESRTSCRICPSP
jgi:hypothetical protein